MTQLTWIKGLNETPIFYKMKRREIETLMHCFAGSIRRYEAGEAIELEGRRQNEVGVVLDGQIGLMKQNAWNQVHLLAKIREGDVLGELLAGGSMDRSLVIYEVLKPSLVLVFSFQRAVRACSISCEFHYDFIENLMKMIARRNAKMAEQMEITSKKTLRERILTYLSQQIQKQGDVEVTSEMGRLELAEYLCVDRCALTRELNRMKSEGILDYHKNTYQIHEKFICNDSSFCL